jgi:PadR family transcriptional regulator, regulatory protein PadR
MKRLKRIHSGIKRGSAEVIILAVLADGPRHGYEISQRIEEQSDGVLRFTLAALYPTLYRLERRGWLEARWETAGSGRRRRYYHLTRGGRRQLASLSEQWRLFFGALERIVGVARA